MFKLGTTIIGVIFLSFFLKNWYAEKEVSTIANHSFKDKIVVISENKIEIKKSVLVENYFAFIDSLVDKYG